MATWNSSLNRTAFSATLHCLTGCAIGEVLGIVIGTALGWGNGATTLVAVVLAFVFGYALTMLPLLRARLTPGATTTGPHRSTVGVRATRRTRTAQRTWGTRAAGRTRPPPTAPPPPP